MARTRTTPDKRSLSDMPLASEEGVPVYVPIDSQPHDTAIPRTVFHGRSVEGDTSAVTLVIVHREDLHSHPSQYHWTAYDTDGAKAEESGTGYDDAAAAFAAAQGAYPDAIVR